MINRFERTLNPSRTVFQPNWKLQNDVVLASSKLASIEMIDRQAMLGSYRPTLDNIAINLAYQTPGTPSVSPHGIAGIPASTLTGLSTAAAITPR
jgi:hypothetical protein